MSQTRVSNTAVAKLNVSIIVKTITFSIVLAFLLYTVMSLTLLRVIPNTSGVGALGGHVAPVRNNIFPGGNITAGNFAIVNTTQEQGESIVDRARQSFIPQKNVAKVEILSGPFGKISESGDGAFTVDNVPMDGVLPQSAEGKKLLDNEYVAKCVEGACNKGELMIVPANNVYGLPLDEEVK